MYSTDRLDFAGMILRSGGTGLLEANFGRTPRERGSLGHLPDRP